MKTKIKKYISILSLSLILVMQVGQIWAYDVPTAPEAPEAPENTAEAPEVPEAPEAPENTAEAPEVPEAPLAPEVPTAPVNPTLGDNQEDANDTQESEENETTEIFASNPLDSTQQDNEGEGINNGGNVGDTTIKTGDANSSTTVTTEANNNIQTSPGGVTEVAGGGIAIINSGNGSDSDNSGSVKVSGGDYVIQDNDAIVINDLNLDSNSGKNDSSKNVGNTTIETGDANTSATTITAVNTNVDGVAVAEFNVVEDYVGDIILNFDENCVSGCSTTNDVTLKNQSNGTGSDNNASLDLDENQITFQDNDAVVENNLTLNSNSGENTADKNTGGDTNIQTGDANVAANVLTFANNNLTGDVYYTVVNIFGDLVGDIIFPEELLEYAVNNVSLANTGNGSGSENNAELGIDTSDMVFQNNNAEINNNLILQANTGDNSTSGNTGGNSSIHTGDTNIDAQIINIANTNIDGGVWWLVLINEAGNWIGRLFGAPEGSNFAGSQGTEFVVNEYGEITAINANNGSNSNNNTSYSQSSENVTSQQNNAVVNNNLNLSANTGKNSASKNTGGDSSIETGDANIIVNLVNFVNNNIIGEGKLFVSVVNVFGSWIGDFLTPGSTKDATQENTDPAIGGYSENQTNENSSSGSESGDNGSDSSNSSDNESETGVWGQLLAQAASLTQEVAGSNINFEAKIKGNTVEDVFDNSSAGNKIINVNLAWLLLALPLALTFIIIKKRLTAVAN